MERFAQRLIELREQLTIGEQRMAQIDRERAELSATMLRISGAIQILEELQAEQGEAADATTPHAAAA